MPCEGQRVYVINNRNISLLVVIKDQWLFEIAKPPKT
jgi:hypothetical protein